MRQFRHALHGAIIFAVSVGFFLLGRALLPEFDGLAAQAVTGIGIALVSGLLSYFLVDVLLGRTVLEARWHVDGEETVGRQVPLKCGVSDIVNFSLKIQCADVRPLAGWAERSLVRSDTRIQITFKPTGPLRYVKQRPAEGVTFVDSVLTLSLVDGLFVGEVAWAEFTAKRLDAADLGNRIQVRAVLRSDSRVPLTARALLRIDSGIDALVLRGNSGSLH